MDTKHLMYRVVVMTPLIIGDVVLELFDKQLVTESAVVVQCVNINAAFDLGQLLLGKLQYLLLARLANVIPFVLVVFHTEKSLALGTQHDLFQI